MASTSNWYDAFGHEVAHEDEGLDHLKQDALPANKLTTHKVKVKVNNTIFHHGGKSPKKNSKEYIAMKYAELTNTLEFACALTGNEATHAVALPIDVTTVRKFDFVGRGYELPGYQSNDQSTLMSAFIKVVGDNYETYLVEEEALYLKHNGTGTPMTKTDFDSKIKPLLAEIIRYCIKYWLLHPWLTREAAYNNSMAHLKENFKTRADCARLIKEIIAERKSVLLLESLLALKTIEDPSPHADHVGFGYHVFDDNESAQLVMKDFLKHRKYKCDKDNLDYLLDLHKYIQDLPEEQKNKLSKFLNMVPRETEVYKKKKRIAQEAEEKKKRKQLEKEARETATQEKKQKLLEENEQKAKEKAATALASGGTATVEEETDLTDIYAEYKYKIGHKTIVEQKKSGRAAASAKKKMEMDNDGIKKNLIALDGRYLTVEYTKPGAGWTHQMSVGISNLCNAMTVFNQDNPQLVGECVVGATNTGIKADVARVVLAVMLHNSIHSTKELPDLGVHPNFHEPTFIEDLKNTKALWLPTLLTGMLISLHGLYNLVCEDEEMLGMNKKDRGKLFMEAINDKAKFAPGMAKYVGEIVAVLISVDNEIVGDAPLGKKAGATDPFDTVSNLVKED